MLATLALTQGGKPLDLPATWRVFKSGADEAIKTVTSAALAGKSRTWHLYHRCRTERHDGARSRFHHARAIRDAAPQSGRRPPQGLSFDAEGRAAVDRRPSDYRRCVPSSTVLLSRTATFDTALPPATYAISAITGDFRQEKTVKLAQGEEAAAAFEAGLGTLSLSAVLQDAGPPITALRSRFWRMILIVPVDAAKRARSRASDPKFTLPPGTYYINVSAGFAETRELVRAECWRRHRQEDRCCPLRP